MTLHQIIAGEHRKMRRLVLCAGAAALLGVAATLLVLAILVLGGGQWITLPAILPMLFWGVLAIAVGTSAVLFRSRVRQRMSETTIASAVERERGLRVGALRGALEVGDASALGRANASRVAHLLGTGAAPLAPVLRGRFRRGALVGAAAAVAALALLVLAAMARPDGALAIVHPLAAYEGSLVPALEVHAPGIVRRGERVSVTVVAVGRRSVDVQHRITGRPMVTTTLRVVHDTARTTIGPLEAAVTMVAGDGRTLSDTLAIRVVERPFLGDVRVRAKFPRYLGRAPEMLPIGEPARVPRGTSIEMTGHASTHLKRVALRRGSESVALQSSDRTFRGGFVATDRMTGRWEWDAAGVTETIADLPGALELDVRPDSLPTVAILSPESDTLLAAATRVLIRGAASDDHGVSEVVVRSWRVAGGRTAGAITLQRVSGSTAEWNGDVPLDLAARGVEPGDALHVVLEATDNSPWRQRGESRELVIRVPSASERRELARRMGDSAVAAASAAVSSQKDLERRTGEAAKSRGQRQGRSPAEPASSAKSSAVPYESTQQARAILREQQGLSEKVKALQQSAAALEQQLKMAGALDSALARQLAETQSLLKDALTPELAQQMQALERAMQQMSPEQMRASLSEMQKQQQRLREQLERSVEMLRRAALEGSMQTLRDEARELATAERALADSLKAIRGDPALTAETVAKQERAQDRAGDLAERSRELSRDVSKLGARLEKEKAVTGTQRTRSAASHAERAAAGMERAASPQGASPQEQNASAERGADDAAKSMEKAAEELAEMRKAQIEEWKEELTSQLDNSIQELLQLAQQQNALQQETEMRGSESMPGVRSRQNAVQQGTDRAARRVGAAGRKSSLLGSSSQRAMNEARREVAEATEMLTESQGDQRGLGNEMREAGEALNRAASALVKDRERAGNAASASGFTEMLQRMQQLAKQQGALGAQGESMLQVPGGDISGELRSSLRSMARRQRALAQQLEEMSDGEAGGRAAELAREARQIARNLDAGTVDAATVARQQQLFRRLLDAGRTMEQNERDDTGQREAQAAAQGEAFSPSSGNTAGRAVDRFTAPQWNDLRGLSADERRAVLEYFRRINAERP